MFEPLNEFLLVEHRTKSTSKFAHISLNRLAYRPAGVTCGKGGSPPCGKPEAI